jgi:AraC family transcriptional regulator
MSVSAISLVDAVTGDAVPSAPVGGVLASSSDAGWRGIIVEHHRLEAMEMIPHSLVGHRLVINVGQPVPFEWKNGASWSGTTYQTDSFAMQSHGDFHAPRWHQPFEFIAVALEPEFVGHLVGNSHVEFEEVRGTNDRVISELALRFQQVLATNSQDNLLFAESLTTAFAFHLLENYCVNKSRLRAAPRRLQGQLLKNVVEFAYDNLAKPLTLQELAAQAYLSPFHFARQFRAATGLSPHQFLLKIRIQKAQQLLRINRSSTQTAFAAGFYDQSHFVHAFKRVTGYTPRAFLRQC